MGHTVVLLAYSVDRASGESLTKTSAKRRAPDLVHAKDAAQKVATLRADRARKQKARIKPIPEPAPITDTDVVDHEKAKSVILYGSYGLGWPRVPCVMRSMDWDGQKYHVACKSYTLSV